MKKTKHISNKRIVALFIVFMMIISLVGCGNKKEEAGTSAQLGINGYVYVPKYSTLPTLGENMYMGSLQFVNNNVIFSMYEYNEETQESKTRYYKRGLEENAEAEELPITFDESTNVMKMLFGENDEMYLFVTKYDPDILVDNLYPKRFVYLEKYDSSGNQIYSNDISDLADDEYGLYIDYAAVDTKGRVIGVQESKILLFDVQGKKQGEIMTSNSYINSLFADKAGNVYVLQDGEEGMSLSLIDYEGKSFKETYKNMPHGQYIFAGGSKDFIVATDSKVYEYSLETQTCEEILDWLDSDINGQSLQGMGVLEDGRIAVFLRDWLEGSDELELAVLTRKKVDEVAPREVIVIGTTYINQSLQTEAVNFNKTNEKYKVKIKSYIDENTPWHENLYDDATALMINDITSGTGPDIINLSDIVNMEAFAQKGVFIDLSSFLEKSDFFKKEDFLENVMEEYTYNDKLIAIPLRISVRALLAKTSMAGDLGGWSVNDLITYSKENPDIQLFDMATKSNMLNVLMNYNQEFFIDYESGKCNFDSDEFKTILEFANGYPNEFVYDENAKEKPAKLQDDELLLNDANFSSVTEFQMNKLLFDAPSSTVGFPTVDGSYLGSIMRTDGDSFAISAKSKNQETAWEFIEGLLLRDSDFNSIFNHGFSTQKAVLDKMYEKALTPEYVLDENGQPMLDETGAKMKVTHGWSYGNSWSADIEEATQEEVDELHELIINARMIPAQDNQIMSIIMEDAEPYFQGQKSLDEVVKIIQSRVQLYVSENN